MALLFTELFENIGATPKKMEPKDTKKPSKLSQEAGSQESRKLRARRQEKRNIWFGIGMFGLIGWSVAVPALVGAALGVWLDGHYPQRFSWTLTLLISGVAVGCMNAWLWVDKESREIKKDLEDNDE